MGVLIKINDATFSNYVGIADYPIIESLKNLYYMGGTLSETMTDKSGNNNNGTQVGTITIGTKYAEFVTPDGGYGTENRFTAQYITNLVEHITCVALVKKSGNRVLFGSGPATSNYGFMFATERASYHNGTSWINNTFSLADSDNYYIMAYIVDESNAKVYVDSEESGIRTIITQSGGSINNLNNLLNIGGTNRNFAATGDADIAVAAFYDDAITFDQLRDVFSFLRMYATKNGLTVN